MPKFNFVTRRKYRAVMEQILTTLAQSLIAFLERVMKIDVVARISILVVVYRTASGPVAQLAITLKKWESKIMYRRAVRCWHIFAVLQVGEDRG